MPQGPFGGLYAQDDLRFLDVGLDGVCQIGDPRIVHIVGVDVHGITGGIHHCQNAKGGFGIDAEFFGTQQDFFGKVLADAGKMFGGFHGIDVNVNFHGNISFRGRCPMGYLLFVESSSPQADCNKR